MCFKSACTNFPNYFNSSCTVSLLVHLGDACCSQNLPLHATGRVSPVSCQNRQWWSERQISDYRHSVVVNSVIRTGVTAPSLRPALQWVVSSTTCYIFYMPHVKESDKLETSDCEEGCWKDAKDTGCEGHWMQRTLDVNDTGCEGHWM